MSSNKPFTWQSLFDAQAEQGAPLVDYKVRPHTTVLSKYRSGSGWTFEVVLYDKGIATLWSDGRVRVDSAGSRTNTTKNRLNDVLIPLGWKVHSKDGHWYLKTAKPPTRFMDWQDGLIVSSVNIADPNRTTN